MAALYILEMLFIKHLDEDNNVHISKSSLFEFE